MAEGGGGIGEMPEGLVLTGEQGPRLGPFRKVLQEACPDGPLPPLFIPDVETNMEVPNS